MTLQSSRGVGDRRTGVLVGVAWRQSYLCDDIDREATDLCYLLAAGDADEVAEVGDVYETWARLDVWRNKLKVNQRLTDYAERLKRGVWFRYVRQGIPRS